MHRSLLILVVLFVSATAHAGGTRGLSAPDNQQMVKLVRHAEVTVLPAPDDEEAAIPPATELPKSVEQPPAEQTTVVSDVPKAAGELLPPIKAADTKPTEVMTNKVAKRAARSQLRKTRVTTEARIRYELGRYGITW